MDAFTELLRTMEQMSPDEKNRVIAENRKKCICGRCPTYDACMKGNKELLYCFAGKSACPVTRTGCLCPSCPLTGTLVLSHAYYCVKGSEKQLRGS